MLVLQRRSVPAAEPQNALLGLPELLLLRLTPLRGCFAPARAGHCAPQHQPAELPSLLQAVHSGLQLPADCLLGCWPARRVLLAEPHAAPAGAPAESCERLRQTGALPPLPQVALTGLQLSPGWLTDSRRACHGLLAAAPPESCEQQHPPAAAPPLLQAGLTGLSQTARAVRLLTG